MRDLTAKLVDAAAELRSDVMVVLKGDDPKKRDSLAMRVEGFLQRIRNNEEMPTFVHRRDEPGKTTMLIGMGDHEAKDAIVKAIWRHAEREAGNEGLQIWTKEMKDMQTDMRAARQLFAAAREVSEVDDRVLDGLVRMGAVPAPGTRLAGPIRWQAVFFIGPAGSGKCFGRGTKILMADGTEKNAEDVERGDLVMGDDSTPRTVLEVHSGCGPLYRVTPVKGESFVVNEEHILLFKALRHDKKTIGGKTRKLNWRHEDVEMTVRDFLSRGVSYRRNAKLFRVPVEYAEREVEIDPYVLGVWLGDGDAHRFAITTMDKSVEQEFRACVGGFEGLSVRVEKQRRGRALQFHATSSRRHPGYHGNWNPVMERMREMGAMPHKRIPEQYMVNSSRVRLELLAGIVDSDGSLCGNCFEVTQKRQGLATDIARLANSLGLFAGVHKRVVKGKDYYRVMISGDIDAVPVRLKRKAAAERGQKKSVLHTGFSIEPAGTGPYFGFEVDGNHRHLLGDFTVVHNSFVKTKKYLKHLDFKEVDPDEIKRTHPNYDPERPFELHGWSKEIAAAQLKKLLTDGSGSPVIVDGTGRNWDKVASRMKLAEDNGYRTYLVYVYVPFEVSIWRNRNRERFVPEDVIQEQSRLIEKSYGQLRRIADKSKVILNYEKPELELARQDIELYPVPQPVRPPRPGDPDYGQMTAERAASEILAAVREIRGIDLWEFES